jgi:hypothetical protein
MAERDVPARIGAWLALVWRVLAVRDLRERQAAYYRDRAER